MDYARVAATARRLMTGAKQGNVTLTRTIPGEPDPSQPWVPVDPTEEAEPLLAIVKGVSAQFVDGETIKASDREVLCAPPAMGIEPADVLTIDGKPVTVIRRTDIPGAGIVAAIRIITRG